MIAFTNYRDRHYLWGPDGSYSYELFRQSARFPNYSLYQLSSDRLFFELVYHMGIIVTLLFIFGTFGRSISLLQLVFVASLNYRNPIILDGGDNIAFLVLFWLVLADSSAISTRLKRRTKPCSTPCIPVITLLHNVAITAIITQLVLLYFLSGLYKAQGSPWYEGTALYYIFQALEFSWPPLTDALRDSLIFGLLASYVTIFFQISVTVGLLRPDTCKQVLDTACTQVASSAEHRSEEPDACFEIVGSNTMWSSAFVIDAHKKQAAAAVANDGRSRVVNTVAQLARRLVVESTAAS